MTAFWLTWKPSGWPLENLQDLVARVHADPETTEPWRIQAHTRASIAARVFVFKQGPEPRGIFGVGEIAELPRPIPEESKNPGAPQQFAPIRFYMLEDPTKRLLLPLEELSDIVPAPLINAQASGATLSDKAAAELERRIGLKPAMWKLSPHALTDRAAVLSAIREFDARGRATFLRTYGFGEARDYLLTHEGKTYDSKAIVGVAFKYQDGVRRALGPRAFSGGAETVQSALEKLGFEVAVGPFEPDDETPSLAPIEPTAGDEEAFDPVTVEDARERIIAAIVSRRGQTAFRNKLIAAYAGRCAITGCDVLDVLEAAHITPYLGAHSNHVGNGLLLRADLHTLFDVGRLAIDPDTLCVLVHPAIEDPAYRALHGQPIRAPSSESDAPSRKALARQRGACGF